MTSGRIVITCQRGAGWPSTFTVKLVATAGAQACVGVGEASTNVTIGSAPCISVVGLPSDGICEDAESKQLIFAVSSAQPFDVTVESGPVACTADTTKGEGAAWIHGPDRW